MDILATFFIILIYITFIGLGLPDSLHGASWAVMRLGLGAPVQAAGAISMLTAGCTVVSSLLCIKLVDKFGTGKVTAASVFITAFALLGAAASQNYYFSLLMAVPLGLGAGCIDAALNNYVALHYTARHMNWLHCFWGLGASSGPLIMSFYLAKNNWRGGFITVAGILFAIAILLLVTLPMWKQQEQTHLPPEISEAAKKLNVFKIKGVLPSVLIFLFYCAGEWSVGLWSASFLVEVKNLSAASGARGAALFFAGITLGRFVAGLVSSKISSKQLIRIGLCLIFAGGLLLATASHVFVMMLALLLIGLGMAPVFPALIHQVPVRFGKDQSQKVVSLQMAFAYMGNTFFPSILGLVAAKTSLAIMPFFVLACVAVMLFLSEYVNAVVRTAPEKP